MKLLRILAISALVLECMCAAPVPAQSQTLVVQTCGSLPVLYTATQTGRPTTLDVNGNLCVNATVSATATIAAFAPAGTNNALSVTTTTARTALTGAATNSTALVENTGAVDVFVAFGDGTVTVTAANGTRVPAGWAIAFNIGTGTNIAYITASSTSTINATTGTGLPALGAAGSGGSGGAVTNAGTFAVQLTGATNNINNIAGTVSLPTGAATSANQSTEITALQAIQASAATTATNTGAAIPTQATSVPIGGVTNDPCQYATKTNIAIASATGTTQVVAPSGSTQVYVCSFSLIAAATAVVNLVGGTGATCTTGTPVAALGSTTAASGASLAANGGLTFGNGGATVVRTTTAGHGLCLIQSGTTALAGNITYVQQ